ncbi:tRNA uridine(34) 5-carboxymethylaminomethyl modification radical SAM/GNAT enzyme Elp3 [archaeon]|nr:tRNA uridine(34) 5-carboxymethylaminomethyl modification radical SAM/GNAT enzyme Elp3 [archaeon]
MIDKKLQKLAIEIAKKEKLSKTPKFSEIGIHQDQKFKLKPTRTISGVSPIAIMTKPYNCPAQAKCTYCPGGLNSYFGDVPKSYTGNEPASMRAKRNSYDPYLQIFNRVEHYIILNHNPTKVELIIMGGTFNGFTLDYQKEFVKYAFKAMNDFSDLFYKEGKLNKKKFIDFFELDSNFKSEKRTKKIQNKILKLKKKTTLEKEHKRNEKTIIRCIGLTLETRPDMITKKTAEFMLKLGATRIELGIQSVYDNVLKKIKRGHLTNKTKEAIKILKDYGFKILLHIMLGLPKSPREKDIEMFKELFSNEFYKPDMIKIYPCLVMPGTKLYQDYLKGNFKPITTKEAAEVIAEGKKYIPTYCRIMRIQRDIPTTLISSGIDKSNLRQYVLKELEKKKIKCKCIRCREVGRAEKLDKVEIIVKKYKASSGTEYFISAEDKKNDSIIGFCRLRLSKNAFIRELHVYSSALNLKEKSKESYQHRGYGKKLLAEAEKITKKNKFKKLAVISGVGVREYYKKLGYKFEAPYMIKKF